MSGATVVVALRGIGIFPLAHFPKNADYDRAMPKFLYGQIRTGAKLPMRHPTACPTTWALSAVLAAALTGGVAAEPDMRGQSDQSSAGAPFMQLREATH